MNTTHAHPQPVQNRTQAIDALRGFALLGIYVSIIHAFNSSMAFGQDPELNISGLESVIGVAMTTFINLRFIGIFSLLFGLGIAIQERNFEARNTAFGGYFVPRMLILAVFGLLNTTFLFYTEILLVYAVFGLLVWGICQRSLKLALTLAVFSLVIWGSFFEITFRDAVLNSFEWYKQSYSYESVKEIFSKGPLVEMIKIRWIEYGMIYADNGFHLGSSFAMITFGYAIGKKDLHTKFIENLGKYRALFGIALLITVVFGLAAIVTNNTFFALFHTPATFFPFLAFQLSSMFVYIYAICLFTQKSKGKNLIIPALANNGRISLSGYIGGAIVYSFIFYGYGLNLYGEATATEMNVIALSTYFGLSVFSALWLKKFQQGPLEWVLRRLSYGKLS